MSYDMYRYIFIVSMVLCILMAVISVLIFIFMKIPSIIGDLSGSTARRAIENIRRSNENLLDIQSSTTNTGKIKRTEKISIPKQSENSLTQKINISNETALLYTNNTAILNTGNTTVLQDKEYNNLENSEITSKSMDNVLEKQPIEIIDEVVFVNSDEII